MEALLTASATSAGTLFSSTMFRVPAYQREYAWEGPDVVEFMEDLRVGLDEGTYFLGLVILTEDDDRKEVVDGQQRLLTITLLARAIHHEAARLSRKALADRIEADFLKAIDYDTDEVVPRVILSDADDQAALAKLSELGPPSAPAPDVSADSPHISVAFAEISRFLRDDLAKTDAFRRLGAWADYLTNRVHLAVFIHPDSSAAYRVFEVINTRGRDLTTADLLKSYILHQTSPHSREYMYERWQGIASQLGAVGGSAFAQYIRHVVTVHAGYVLPRDLYDYLSDKQPDLSLSRRERPPAAEALVEMLERHLPLYLQMIDPEVDGPADAEWLKVFSALNDLSVVAVRPLLLAIASGPDPDSGMRAVLRLVVRRIVVGNLGTGNVERRLSDAARQVRIQGYWKQPLNDLDDLDPSDHEFFEQVRKRSFNPRTLAFLRRSDVESTVTPTSDGFLHLIRPRQAGTWTEFGQDDFTYWGSTVGNSFLTKVQRRPKSTNTWQGFLTSLVPEAVDGEKVDEVRDLAPWTAASVEQRGEQIARRLGGIWQ